MVTFHDGPAAGVQLQLRRLPKYLRVTTEGPGKWDALDQLEDTPRRGERIIVYTRCDDLPISKYHLYCGRKGGSGWYYMATYKVLPDQPPDADMRTNEAWQRWCMARPDAPKE